MANQTPAEMEIWRRNEETLIGTILVHGAFLGDLPGVSSRSFQSRKNRRIWEAIEHLSEQGEPIQVVPVAEYLDSKGYLKDIGGELFLSQLMESSINPESVDHYAGRVLEAEATQAALLKWDVIGESLRCGKLSDANREIAEIQKLTERTTKQRFKILTAEELSNSESEHSWLIKGVAVNRQLCVMAAGKKTCKTNLSIEMGVCIASRLPFLGKFQVPTAQNVLMVSGESGEPTTRETLRRVAKSKGRIASQIKNLHFHFGTPAIDDPASISELRRIIRELGITVLFIDPVYLCLNLGDGMKNLFSVGEKLKPILALGDEAGCTIILIHHTRKSNGLNVYAEPELEEIYGSGFQEITRQWILLGRRSPYKPDQAGHHELYFVAGGSAGHSQSWALNIDEGSIEDEGGRIWETNLFPIQEARAEKRSEKERQKLEQKDAQAESDKENVLNELESIGKPVVASKVRDSIPLSTPRTKIALAALVKSGQVVCEEMKAANNRPADHYSLATGSTGRSGINGAVPVSRSSGGQERDTVLCNSTYPAAAPSPESVTDNEQDFTVDYPADQDDTFHTDPQYDDSYFTEGF